MLSPWQFVGPRFQIARHVPSRSNDRELFMDRVRPTPLSPLQIRDHNPRRSRELTNRPQSLNCGATAGPIV